jgi:hypothetical protein
VKFDEGKPRVSLLPAGPLLEVAACMTMGAKKYSDHNYRKGMDHSRLLDAALRHILQWNQGCLHRKDEESGYSLGARVASLLMLMEIRTLI